MSIKIGQIRKNPSTQYISTLSSYSLGTFQSAGAGSTTFSDFAIRASFRAGTTYYVRVAINRININTIMGNSTGAGDNDPHNQYIDIKLFAEDTANSEYQRIGESILVEPYLNEDTASSLENESAFMNWCAACIRDNNPSMNLYPGASIYYANLVEIYNQRKANYTGLETNITEPTKAIEIVFTPYRDAQVLVFQLSRVAYDYSFTPRVVSIDTTAGNRDIATVNNLFNGIIDIANKIGVQSRPGALVVINQTPMRLGKSGILEINNGIPITYFGMVAPSNQVSEFLADYFYTA